MSSASPKLELRTGRDLPETGDARRDEEALEVVRLEVLDLVRDARAAGRRATCRP